MLVILKIHTFSSQVTLLCQFAFHLCAQGTFEAFRCRFRGCSGPEACRMLSARGERPAQTRIILGIVCSWNASPPPPPLHFLLVQLPVDYWSDSSKVAQKKGWTFQATWKGKFVGCCCNICVPACTHDRAMMAIMTQSESPVQGYLSCLWN